MVADSPRMRPAGTSTLMRGVSRKLCATIMLLVTMVRFVMFLR